MRLEARKYLLDIQIAPSVDDRIVWGVLENHLVPLRQSVTQLLARP